jgi:hypothetical protein
VRNVSAGPRIHPSVLLRSSGASSASLPGLFTGFLQGGKGACSHIVLITSSQNPKRVEKQAEKHAENEDRE